MNDAAAGEVLMTAGAREVLVVEDDDAMAELERRALGRAGFAAHVAASAADARDRLAAMVLDYNLPGGAAWSLVALARQRTPPIPVILVTAMGSETVAAEAVLHGVAEYIRKSNGLFARLGGAVERAVRLASADEELRRNDALFRMVADNAHDAIVLLDGSGTILFASSAAEPMLGAPPAALIGRNLADFIGPAYRTAAPRDDRAPPRHGTGCRVYRVQLPGGPAVCIEPTFATIGSGDATRTLGVLRDVTERVRLEEQVRHQQRMEAIGQLTGGLAHDFNNLLGVMIGNLDLLRGEPGVSERVQAFAQDALDAAMRGAELTNGLLAFARRQDLRPLHSDLNVSVRSMARLLGRVLGEDISMELRLADDLWPVSVDPAQLKTALTNLAANARDAMPRGGRLVIATRNAHLDAADVEVHGETHGQTMAGDYASVEVSDNGGGMPQDVLGRVFEPFYTTKGPGKGSGLGLAMVFGFIRQSGGHIHAESEIGRGTIFRLYFPRATAPEAVSAATRHGVPGASIGAGRTILVVEDNAKLRQLTVRQLEAARFHVLAAEDAAAALATIDGEAAIDLLFTDIVMPGGVNGIDLARQAVTRRPGLKVLLTSGFPDLHAGDDSGTRSPYPLLHKPYRSDALLRAIDAALD